MGGLASMVGVVSAQSSPFSLFALVCAHAPMMGVGPDIPTAATRTPLMRAQRGSTRAARAWVKQWQASHGPPQYRAPVGWCASHCSAPRCAGHCTRQQDIPLVLLQLSSTPARALLTHEKWMRTWWTLNPEHHCRSRPGQRGLAGGLAEADRSSGQPEA